MIFRSKKGAARDPQSPPPLPERQAEPPELPPYEFPDQRFSEQEPPSEVPPRPAENALGPGKQLQAAFGQIAALLSRLPNFQNLQLAMLRTAVIPAISTGQFLIAEGRNQKTGRAGPIAAVLWAEVSVEVSDRLTRDRRQLWQLSEADRKSGDIVWLTLAAGEQRLLGQMIDRLRATNFKGRPVNVFVDGGEQADTLEAR